MDNQDHFTGNAEDLEAFLKVARSPIRHPDRSAALEAWRKYKMTAMLDRYRAAYEQREDGSHWIIAKGWNIQAMTQRLIDLSGINLDGAVLGFVDLRGVRLDGATLRGAWMKNAEMEWASLRGASFAPPDDEAVGAYTGYSRLLNADLSHADLAGADLSYTDLSGVNLAHSNLDGAKFCHCDLSRANIVGASLLGTEIRETRIHVISAWDIWICDDESLRRDLIVTPEYQAELRVDDIEVAQFVYLLLNRKKLRNVINAVTRRGVLILGRFRDGGLEVLQAVAGRLRELGYIPLLFDSEGPEDRDLTETILTMASLARFVIADLSGPSVLKELEAIVADVGLPVVPILEKGRRHPSMFKDFLKFDWVHSEILSFPTPEVLTSHIESDVVRVAEAMLADRSDREVTIRSIG